MAVCSNVSTPQDEQRKGCVLIVSNRYTDGRDHIANAVKMTELWENQIKCDLFLDQPHIDQTADEIENLLFELSDMNSKDYEYVVVIIISDGGLSVTSSDINKRHERPVKRAIPTTSKHDNSDIKHFPETELEQFDNTTSGSSWTVFGKLSSFVTTMRRGLLTLLSHFRPSETYSPFILGSDNVGVPEEKILRFFENGRSSWQGKKRFFILSYPRYSSVKKEMSGVSKKDYGSRVDINPSSSGDSKRRDPLRSEFLLVHATSSSLIGNIFTIFRENWERASVIDMLTMVNEQMTRTEHKSVFESFLCSTFHLCEVSQQSSSRPAIVDRINQKISNSDTKDDQIIDQTMVEFAKELQRCPKEERSIVINSLANVNTEAGSKTSSLPRNSDRYRTLKKGCALIISNSLGKDSTSHVDDARKMERLWRNMGCDVYGGEAQLNKTKAEMEKLFSDLSVMDSDDYEYVVIIISSHGGLEKKEVDRKMPDPNNLKRLYVPKQISVSVDNKVIEEEKLLSYLENDHRVSTWENKVKICIFDYCRGNIRDRLITKAFPIFEDETVISYDVDENICPLQITRMPKECIVVHATTAYFVAYSNGLTSVIDKIFKRHWRWRSLMDMLTYVNAKMKSDKSMSEFKSTLTKDVYFEP